MDALLEPAMGEKPALQPKSAIGPVMRAIAANNLATARAAIADPERTPEDAVHDFRRAMKEWRALMRLLAPFIPDAARWRHEARDHARSLAHARDGAAALTAFEGLLNKGILVLSTRSGDTIRGRLEALRASEEQSVLTPALRDRIVAWLDAAAAAVETMAARSVRFFVDCGATHRRLPRRPPPHPHRLVDGQRRRPAHAAPARGQSAVPDGIGRAVVAALWPHVDRRSRAAARTARPMPGSRSAQAAHRAAPALGALAFAAVAGHCRAVCGAGASRRTHRAPAICRTVQIVPPAPRNAMGACALKAPPRCNESAFSFEARHTVIRSRWRDRQCFRRACLR